MADDHAPEIRRLTAEATKRRLQARDLRRQNAELMERLAALEEENTTLRAGFEEVDTLLRQIEGDPEGPLGRVAELEREILARDHRDAFRDLYADAELGLNGSIPVEDLWQLIGYSPEGEPDPESIRATLAGLRESKGFLFAAPTAPTSGQSKGETPATPARPPGPGANRGGRDTSIGTFTVSRADMGNAEWMRQNQSKYADAVSDGSIRYVD
jgi:hypothetical protein